MANATDVVGYTYEGEVHCVSCTEERFGEAKDLEVRDLSGLVDNEGNNLHPIFAMDEGMACDCCGGTGSHMVVCGGERASSSYDCDTCESTGFVAYTCGDCGKEIE